MRRINYPLIFSDFDGTLLRSDGTIAEETRNTIAQYVQDGGLFVLCSGRMTPSILKQARALGLTGFVAAYNGAEVVDIQSGERLFKGTLPQEDAIEMCKVLEKHNLHFHIYDGDHFYSSQGGEYFALYEKVCQVKGTVATDMPLSALIKQQNIQVVKIAAVMAYEDRERIYTILDNAFGDRYAVVRSAKFLVEICDTRYTKGTALDFVARKYDIPIQKTVAIGDNQNDLTMLETAGVGLAVANGEESLKGKVAFYKYGNDENAVGKIIEEYGYTEEENE